MSLLLAEPAEEPDPSEEPRPVEEPKPSMTPQDPAYTAAHDQLTTSILGTSLPTFGGRARLRHAARAEPWL